MAKIPKLPEALRDFRNALWEIMPLLNLPNPTPLQYDLAGFLQGPEPKKMIWGYRGIGKSMIAVAWSVHKHRVAIDDRGHSDIHTLFGSAGKDYADEISAFAKKLMVEVPFYRCMVPSADQFTSNVKFDVGQKALAKDPSFKSAGIFGQMTGSRANDIYLDDIEIPNTAGTVGMRDKLKQRVEGVPDILPPEGGFLNVLGTPHLEDTVYNWLIAQGGWAVRFYPARYPGAELRERWGDSLAPVLRERLEADPSLEGQATDPDRFDEKRLQDRAAGKSRSHFARQYLLDTTLGDKEAHPLRLSDLIVTDLHPEVAPTRVIWGQDNAIEDIPIWGLAGDRFNRPIKIMGEVEVAPYTGAVMIIDPSGRGKDETAWCVSKILNATVFVTDFGGYLEGFEKKTMRALAETAKQWGVNEIEVETNFGDGMFETILMPHLRAIKYNVTVTSKRSTGQKEQRVCDTLEPIMNQHRLVVDRGALQRDAASRDEMGTEQAMQYRLAYQISRMTRSRGSLVHDDRIEVFARAAGYWTEHLAQSAEDAEERNRDDEMDDIVRNWGGQDTQANWTKNFIPNQMR